MKPNLLFPLPSVSHQLFHVSGSYHTLEIGLVSPHAANTPANAVRGIFFMFHPSGAASFSRFSDELTAQRKLLFISAQHCPLSPKQTVMGLIKVIKALNRMSLLTKNKLANMFIVVFQLKGFSVMSRVPV